MSVPDRTGNDLAVARPSPEIGGIVVSAPCAGSAAQTSREGISPRAL